MLHHPVNQVLFINKQLKKDENKYHKMKDKSIFLQRHTTNDFLNPYLTAQ